MIAITLPDGSKREFAAAVSIQQLAESIGPGLAKAALAGKVDGQLVDASFLIERDSAVSIITVRDVDGIDVIRHSCAHLMANAVKNLFPAAQVTIGPVIEKQQKIVNDCVEKKISLSNKYRKFLFVYLKH